jgi:signal transduction histidine kinase
VLPIRGEQKFLADLKKRIHLQMLILPNRIQRLAFLVMYYITLLCVTWFNAANGRAVEALNAVKKTVLVLVGDRLSIPAVKMTDQGLMAGLSRGTPEDPEIFSEYLDLSRFPAAQYGGDLVRYLRARYAARKPDVVIAGGSSALDLALAHRDELFAGVPIVFANVDHREVEGREISPTVTGLWMAWDYQRTVELALQLQPETREIVCVSGTGSEEQRYNSEARKVLEHFATRVRTRWLDKLPLPAVLNEVGQLPPDSVVLYIPMLRDGAGKSVSPFEVAGQLAQASRVPVYGLTRPQLEQGIIGGALLDFSEIGHKTAALALRVLAGERPPTLSPPDPSTNPLLINWRALKKWHVSESRIPPEAAVLYRDPSLWEQHRGLILATAAVISLQSLLIVGLIVQRSRLKRAQESLRDSEGRMSLAAEAANLGVWVWDVVRDEIWMTDKGRALFGLAPNTRLDYASLIARVHPEDRGARDAATRRALETQEDYVIEYRVLLPDGQVRWIGGRGRVEFGDGKPLRMRGVSLDITERRQAELEAARQRNELTHALRLTTVGELTASIAHEINQPLGAILSNAETAEILLESNQPHLEEVKQILADIRKDDLRASEVIRHMRELLRKRELELEPIDLNAAASDVLRLVAGEMHRQGVKIEKQFADTLPVVRGDGIHLQQVLLNLILNGMEAMSESSEPNRRLTMRTAYDGKGNVEVAVKDSGPGIPPDRQPRLFDSFFTTKPHGMGLGLSIVRSIVEAHGGRIWAENNSSGGACFRFTLPVNGKE